MGNSCDELNSGVLLGAQMLKKNSKLIPGTITIDDSWKTITGDSPLGDPTYQEIYQQYLQECSKLKEPTGKARAELAFDVFLDRQRKWVKDSVLKGYPSYPEKPLEERLGIIMRQMRGIIQPFPQGVKNIPGNIGREPNNYRGSCVEVVMLTSLFLGEQGIPHYIKAGRRTVYDKNWKIVSDEGHSFIIVQAKGKKGYLFDTSTGDFVSITDLHESMGGLAYQHHGNEVRYTISSDNSSISTSSDSNRAALRGQILNNFAVRAPETYPHAMGINRK